MYPNKKNYTIKNEKLLPFLWYRVTYDNSEINFNSMKWKLKKYYKKIKYKKLTEF